VSHEEPAFALFYTGYGGDPIADARSETSPFSLCGYSCFSDKFESRAIELGLKLDCKRKDHIFVEDSGLFEADSVAVGDDRDRAQCCHADVNLQPASSGLPKRAQAPIGRPIDLGDIKLIDDPRFVVSLDVKELKETEPARRQIVYDAIVKEVRQLIELGTFEWEYLKPGAKPLSSRLVLKTKYHADGSFDKEKCRLTIRGCFQVAGRDYDNTFAPTAKAVTGRLLDAAKVLRGFFAKQADISNAFCQADIDLPVYIDLPRGISIVDSEVCSADRRSAVRRRALRLRRALYGLRQSPRLFWCDLRSTIEAAGFVQCRFDPCLFQRWSPDHKKVLYVLCYVDDLKLIGNCEESLDMLQKALQLKYGLTPFNDLSSFLGMNYMMLDDGSMTIDMRAKIDEMLSTIPFEIRTSRLPFDGSLGRLTTGRKCDCPESWDRDVLVGDLTPVEKWLLKNYSSVVGMVGWPAKMCRPDLAQAFSMLSRNLASPEPCHARFLAKLMCYCNYTKDTVLLLRKPSPADGDDRDFADCSAKFDLVGYSDSNYADKLDDRWRATTGYCWMLEGLVVSWKAKRQDVTGDSTFKVEMLAAHAAFSEGVWLRELANELGLIDISYPSQFWCDNKSTIFTLNSETMSWKQTHLTTKFFACKDQIDAGHFVPDHIAGLDNPADMFTKGLDLQSFNKHCQTIGLRAASAQFQAVAALAPMCRRSLGDLVRCFAVFR
jgi:hypothetical protein